MIRAVTGLHAVGVSVAVLVSAPRAQTSAIQAAFEQSSIGVYSTQNNDTD
jgi:hypothetical protein